MTTRSLPLPAPADLSTVTVLSGGEELSPQVQLLSVVVERSVNRIPTATLLMIDGSASEEDFPLSSADFFAPGREVEIHAGYHSQEALIFRGIVVRHGLRSVRERSSMLTVVCKDPAVRMTVGRSSAYFAEESDADIIEGLINRYGLTPAVEGLAVVQPGMLQYQATDWDFLLTRAEANGCLVLVEDGTVAIRPPDTSGDPVLTLRYGATLLELEAELDVEQQFAATETAAWDPAAQQALSVEGADPGLAEQGASAGSELAEVLGLDAYRLHSPVAATQAELQAWSDGLLSRSRLAKARCRLRCQGIADPLPGRVVELEGVGERFSGIAFVSAVRHELTRGNWLTDIQTGLDHRLLAERPDVAPPPAAGLLPPIDGLHVGIVSRIEGDPAGEDRVQVRLPLVDPQHDGLWARLARLDAGADRGTVFWPEVGDEVIVGFLNRDPRQAVVLGAVHSSAHPSPVAASEENARKGYISRSNIRLLFDDERHAVTLELESGRRVTVDDEAGELRLADGDGNAVTLNADGIALGSSGTITLSAGGDVQIAGMNVEIAAQAALKLEGSASAELSSGGITTVEGSLVKIN